MATRFNVLSGIVVGSGLAALAGTVLARSPEIEFRLASTPIDVGPMAAEPVVADMDADGDLDVVIVCGPCCGRAARGDSGHTRVLLNDGKGVLSLAGERVKLGPTALGAAVGDVNGDGHLDVVAHHHSSYDAGVMLGDGRGGLASPVYFPLHEGANPHVHSIALADTNGDGILDILATLVNDHAMAVLLGDGKGGFRPALGQPFYAHRHPYTQLTTTDINGDGAIDAVMTDMVGCGLTVLVGSGTGMFSPLRGFAFTSAAPIKAAERPMGCALGDIDRDGDLDAVAFIDESPTAVRLINRGGGEFEEPDGALIDLGSATVGGVLADVTGDGVLDLVASGTGSARVSVCAGGGDGTFIRAQHVDAGGRSPHAIAADMNGDGRADIITGNYDSGTVSVLLNIGRRGG